MMRQSSVENAIRQSMRMARHLATVAEVPIVPSNARASTRRAAPVINQEGVDDEMYEDAWAAAQVQSALDKQGSLINMPKAVEVQVSARGERPLPVPPHGPT
jgi:hypothetical protein